MEINLNVNVQLNASSELLGAIQSLVLALPGKTTEVKPVVERTSNGRAPARKPLPKTEPEAEATTTELKNQAGEVVDDKTEVAGTSPDHKVENTTEEATNKTEVTTNGEATEKTVTVEQLREAVRVKAQNGFREELKKILTTFDAPNVTSLKEDQYSAFMAKVEAL